MTTNYYKNKNVLITGASSGIGKSLATHLAKRGANLILVARSEDKLNNLKQELSFYNVDIHIFKTDLSVPEEVLNFHTQVKSLGIKINILINNAGFGMSTNYLSQDYKFYSKMVSVNILAILNLTSLFLPEIMTSKGGGVINISSTGAFQPLPYQAVYGGTKAFVLSYTEALYGEYLNKDVHFMALCPGFTETNFKHVSNAPTMDTSSMSPDRVAQDCLKYFEKQRMVHIPGKNNYLTSILPRILSRLMTVKIVRNMFKENFSQTTHYSQ